jgi:hypothetical protein
MKLIPVTPGDNVTLRKPHPCGGYTWTVTRVGADIGLRCDTCGRRVMLEREEFERRVKMPPQEAVSLGESSAASEGQS